MIIYLGGDDDEEVDFDYWVGKNGKRYEVTSMQKSHIHNVLRMIKHGRFKYDWLELFGDEWHEVLTAELERRKGTKMKNTHLVHLLADNFYTVGVMYPEGSNPNAPYTFLVHNSIKLADEDMALVVNASGVPKVVKVMEVHTTPQIDTDSHHTYKWVAQKVDLGLYDQLLEADRKALNALRNVERTTVVQKARALLAESVGEDAVKGIVHVLNDITEG